MIRATALLLATVWGVGACSEVNPAAALEPQAPARGVSQGREPAFVPGQVIVRFHPGANRSRIAAQHRAQQRAELRLPRTVLLRVPPGAEIATAALLSRHPQVEFAEPDWIMQVGPCAVSTSCTLPDGQYFHYKWDLHNTGKINDQLLGYGVVSTGRADADIDWAEAYEYLGPTFSGAAIIAILDTGIRSTHTDFSGKIVGGQRFLDDGVNPGNFNDDHGHGSHVAGIAAGLGSSRVPGVAYGSAIRLLIGKVCNASGNCASSAVADGIVWAVDNGANVINLSMGGFGGAADGSGSAAQQAALQYAASRNVLPVCASGNDDGTAGYSGGVAYPARFPECMAVAATTWGDTKASYSNYGPQVAVAAPGGDTNPAGNPFSGILSASNSSDNGFVWRSGTSMATPEVAGVAALLWATGLHKAAVIRTRLASSADDLGPAGWDPQFGAGRINAYRAVTGLDPDAPPVANAGGSYVGTRGQPVRFDGSGSFDPNGKPLTYAWNFGDPASLANTSSLQKPQHSYLQTGSYTVRLTVTDASGLTSTATTSAVIGN